MNQSGDPYAMVGVLGGICADFCRLTLAVQMTVVEHIGQRKAVNQIAPVLVLHPLVEHFPGGRQLGLARDLEEVQRD